MKLFHHQQQNTVCENCDVSFIKRTKYYRDKNRFCTSRCALDFVRTREHQILASKKSAEVMIKKYRGIGLKSYTKENGRHQHRRVMEMKIGRKLTRDEIVHHIDNNKKNNDISNLQLVTRSEHAKIHFHHAKTI